ncbi:UTP--glucose-1-phosphate uridylyltransferase [bacterium]|nr:UTP--glucose-1-phosphate uridylyltransferase [bacterium]
MQIRKAIIPVAGMGTRFLPATKAQPKEMLPVVDKPVIQYIVEEAVAAGIEEVIFVTAIGKRAIEDHFDRNFELEYRLEQKKKLKELAVIEEVGKLAKFAFVRQQKPLGDGHALLAAAPFIGDDESVAVLFGDDIISGEKPAIGELIETFHARGGESVVAVQEVPRAHVSSYGVIDGEALSHDVWAISQFVEKPKVEEAPSNYAAVGRYVITPRILRLLETQEPGKDGEIRLADAFATHLSEGGKLFGRKFSGKRYDCGNKLQFILAQIELGLQHPEVKEGLKGYLESLK